MTTLSLFSLLEELPPGDPDLTDEQREAVERRGGPLLVQAGAGSGKTRVLVERFVRAVLDDGIAVDRILAITFTEKAAAELRTRLRRRFLEAGEREHARAVESAWVSTIHGFCSRLLRAHALGAQLDPEYGVLAEHEAERIASEAYDEALERFVGRPPDRRRLELVGSYGADRVAAAIRALHARERGRGVAEPSLPPLVAPAQETIAAAHARLARAVCAASESLAGEAKPGKQVTAALERLEGCGCALGELAPGGRLDPFELRALAVKRGNARALRGELFDELEAAHAACLGLCADARATEDAGLFGELLDNYGRAYAARKHERSSLDFDDLELLARRLLSDRPALRERIRDRFDHVLVDELQDTNRLQSDLIDLVADDNLFAVGDELQSIYGFRGADPAVFVERRELAKVEAAAVRLRESFRAAPELLDALNATFAPVFGEGFAPLNAPSPSRAPAAGAARVELLAVDRANDRWSDLLAASPHAFGATMEGAPPWRAAEARLLARRVDELVGSREFAPGEVAVLVRSWADVGRYERALAERGLPTYVAGGGGYWSGQQVGDLRAYLACLTNPRDEEALVATLASPLVGASLDALALLRWRGGPRALWETLAAAFGRGDDDAGLLDALPELDRARLAAFVGRLIAERREVGRRSLPELVERAIVDTGYDRFVLSLPGGERRMANLRKLERFAREIQATDGPDVRAFLDAVARRDAASVREGDAPVEGEGVDSIRLMSIHAAKGLEFPLVCVADLGRGEPADAPPLRVAPDGRVGVRLPDPEGGLDALHGRSLAAEAAEAERAEERRLLWVAATRAERRLIVSGALDLETERDTGGSLDWLAPALVPELREAHAAGEREGLCAREWGRRTARVAWRTLSGGDVDAALPAADRAPDAQPRRGRLSVVRSDERERPPAPPQPPVEPALTPGPARISPSALESYRRCGYRFYLERDLGISLEARAHRPGGGGRLDARARGSVVHALLEERDLRRPQAPSEARTAALVRAQGATPRPSDTTALRDLIEGFSSSPLARRMAAARAVRRELPFAFGLEVAADTAGASTPMLVEGVMDAFCREDEGVLVVDYKTDRVAADADLAALCLASYETQRLVYALAALHAGAARVEVAHVFLERAQDPVIVRYAASERPLLERRLAGLAAGLVAGRHEPSSAPGAELCRGCPGRASLCSWPLERTGGGAPTGEPTCRNGSEVPSAPLPTFRSAPRIPQSSETSAECPSASSSPSKRSAS